MSGKEKKAEKPNMWESLLNEAMQVSKPPTGNIIIVGNRDVGKRTLVNNLIKTYNQKIYEEDEADMASVSSLQGNASSIDYAYLDVKNLDDPENNEVITRMNTWILDDISQKDMLNIAFKENVVKNCVIVICLDLTEPWRLKQELERWLTTVSEKLSEVFAQVPLNVQDEIREKLKNYVRNYEEPKFDENGKLIRPFKKEFTEGAEEEEDFEKIKKEMPLPDGVLTVNYGIPIVFCVTKSDYSDTLEREKDGDKKLDLIQMAIREKALTYAASTIYTSSKMNVNLDVFYEYLVHRIYGYGFRFKAEAIQKDSVFVPAGYDRPTILNETFKDLKDENYDNYISEPQNKKIIIREEVSADDNQSFYARLGDIKKSGPPPAILTPASARGQMGFQFPSTTPRNTTTTIPANIPPQPSGNTLAPTMSLQTSSSTAQLPSSGSGTNSNSNVSVVKNFYQNLMQTQQKPAAAQDDGRQSQLLDKEKLLKLISQKKSTK